MEVSFSSDISNDSSLKASLTKLTRESRVTKDYKWKSLAGRLEMLAKNGQFSTELSFSEFSPLTIHDFVSFGFDATLDRSVSDFMPTLKLSWFLNDAGDPPSKGPAKTLYDHAFSFLSQRLKEAARGGRTVTPIYTTPIGSAPKDTWVQWERVLKREGLETERAKNGALIVRW